MSSGDCSKKSAHGLPQPNGPACARPHAPVRAEQSGAGAAGSDIDAQKQGLGHSPAGIAAERLAIPRSSSKRPTFSRSGF